MLNIWSLMIGLFMSAVGLAGIVAPTDVATIAQNATTPVAVWVLAVIVLAIGVVLVRAAATARIPIVVRAVGILAIVCAVALPVFGPRLAEWWAGQSPDVIRLTSLIKIVAGAAIAFSANP